MKKTYYFVIFGAIILIMFSFLNFFKDKNDRDDALPKGDDKKVLLNEEFELQEGDRASMGGLDIAYRSTTLPPDSLALFLK